MRQQTRARIFRVTYFDPLGCLLSLATVGRRRRVDENVAVHAQTEVGETVRKIRVLLADDNETVLARVRMVLGEKFDVVGAVTNGLEAVAEVQRLDPDVLLIDISMPILDGLQAVSRLRGHPQTKIVFLTVHEDQDFVDAAFAVGASGYVAKADVTTDLVPAIAEVLKGQKYLSKSIKQ
jgi:DNA-binding NarL/FixJ family response regulator